MRKSFADLYGVDSPCGKLRGRAITGGSNLMSVRRIAGYGLLVLLVVGGLFAYQNRLYLRMAIQQPQLFREPVLDQSAAPLPADLGAVPILSFSKPTAIGITTALLLPSRCWTNWRLTMAGKFFIRKMERCLRLKICSGSA